MKSASLISAAAIIVIANALALVHAVRNRAGNPEAEITLSNRELRYPDRSAIEDDSGVTLYLQWTDPSWWPTDIENPPNWLDRQKLRTLGFDCGVNPADSGAGRFYERQRPRQVFAAMEYDGAGWRAWIEAYERALAKQRANAQSNAAIDSSVYSSRLVAIDADLDPIKLRARHPDRRAVLILPAVVSITLAPFPSPGMTLDTKRSVQIKGSIRELPSSIHVPVPFSNEFRNLNRSEGETSNKDLAYRVRLRYGSSLEPWVTGVEFTNAH